jgi:hypothetical protein
MTNHDIIPILGSIMVCRNVVPVWGLVGRCRVGFGGALGVRWCLCGDEIFGNKGRKDSGPRGEPRGSLNKTDMETCTHIMH